MDGYKVRAKLALNFPRPVANAEAEEVMMQYARAFAAAVECELSNGDLPFEEHELLKRITDHVQALPKKSVRLIGLHVWHKGAVSSGSMLAVKPPQDTKVTVPAMPAVSQTREKAAAPSSANAAVTVTPPEAKAAAPPSPARPPPASAPSRGVQSPSAGRPGPPGVTLRAPVAADRENLPERGAAATSTVGRSASVPLSGTMGSFPAAARMASGVVPAVDTRIAVRTKSGFLVALEQCAGGAGEEVGRAMAQPIRDSAAGLLLGTLDALHGSIADPLALFDGRASETLRRGLIGEACVCVCYVLYESLTRTSLPQMQSIEVVQAACVHALMDKAMPVSEISRYLATESPREEFSGRVCALLGVREGAEMQQRVESSLRVLRLDVKSCADQIEQRLTGAKAHSGQKTG